MWGMFDNIIHVSKIMVVTAIMTFFGQTFMDSKNFINDQKIRINELNESYDIAKYEYARNVKILKKKNCISKENDRVVYKTLCRLYNINNTCTYGVSSSMIEKRFDTLLVNIRELITKIENRPYTE